MFKVTPNPPMSGNIDTALDQQAADRVLSFYNLAPEPDDAEADGLRSNACEEALLTTSSILASAAATAYEQADQHSGSNRKLAMAVVHLIEMAQSHLDAVLETHISS